MNVAVMDGVLVQIEVGVWVSVLLGSAVGESVGLGVGVAVDVKVAVAVGLAVWVAVAVGTGLEVEVRVPVAVAVSVGVVEGVAVAVALGVVGVDEGVRVNVGVLVARRATTVSSRVGETTIVGVCGASMLRLQLARAKTANAANSNHAQRADLSLMISL
ncbi:MAG TPA: hypothetical protein VMT24_16090 [Aggregatilineaceae bacterium]|nr:hypothetical protein [Aggregatilineaceae bacterium]